MAEALDLKGRRVLVVDDDFTIRAALRKILISWSAQVTEAEGGPQGIIELKRARDTHRPFDVVLLDSTLSPLSGFEVIERMRAHPEDVARTILMVGSDGVAEDLPRARSLDVGSYVVKPLNRQAILAAVAKVLKLDVGTAIPQEPSRKKLRVLLAEDSSELRWIIRFWLERQDYQVDIAQDGGVAADLFRMIDYDVVLMDIQMPMHDGYWATRGIHAWERQNGMRHTPVIAITAYADQQDPAENAAAGFDAYLVKPFTKETLLAEIERRTRGAARGTIAVPAV
jgi:CheY-like chemotaxis protein